MKELAETNPVEPQEEVPRQDEPENVKGPGHAKNAGTKNLDEWEQDQPSFGELEVTETEAAISQQCSATGIFTRPAMVTRPTSPKTPGGN